MQTEKNGMCKLEMTSMLLHFFAMFFMLLDHMWVTVVPGNQQWMTCVGRLAFPIFAFLTVEGFFHTKNLKRYMGRMLVFALLSELPFNLMLSGSLLYPFHQNVLWCFLLGLCLMAGNEKAKSSGKLWIQLLVGVGTFFLGSLLGMITFVDYGAAGVQMVLLFYFFRGRNWWNYLVQLAGMIYINREIGGLIYEFDLFGIDISFPQQCFAVFALVFIWLYRGKQGPHNKALQLIYYAFYPVHLLVLWMVMRFIM